MEGKLIQMLNKSFDEYNFQMMTKENTRYLVVKYKGYEVLIDMKEIRMLIYNEHTESIVNCIHSALDELNDTYINKKLKDVRVYLIKYKYK